MGTDDVIAKLVEVHREYQEDGGFDDAKRVTADARPLADLKGFESDFIPEIVRRVARELDCPLPKGTRVRNIYVEKGRKLTIREIARKLIEKYAQGVQGMSDPADKKQLIAARLKEARNLAGLSQGQAAKKLGMHRPTISEIEAGNRNVTAPELAQFAELYDVDLAWLSGAGPDQLDPQDERLQLAFRELKKIKPQDLDKLMRALAALRGPKEGE